ncbi:MAG TPA: P1 family peptidase, partial [Steroidobacteraceae bacterium]
AGIQQWTQDKFGLAATPVVAETWDGRLNDLGGFHIQPADAVAAIEAARAGPVVEGNVGGGTGMVCFGFKGGIGTASRKVTVAGKEYTVGVLVQCNTGDRQTLRIAGAPVGPELSNSWLPCYDAALSLPERLPKCAGDGAAAGKTPRAAAAGQTSPGAAAGKKPRAAAAGQTLPVAAAGKASSFGGAVGQTPPDVGSIIIVVATDAPLMPVQLNRVARRAALGLGRLGSYSGNGSGDLIVSFTTATVAANDPDQRHPSALTPLPSEQLDYLFKGVVDATEESVVNALVAAQTMTGADSHRFYGLQHPQLRMILKHYGRLEGGVHAP